MLTPITVHYVRLGIRKIVQRLNAALGATLVAALAGSKDRKMSYKWAQQDGPNPNASAVKPLQFAYAQWILVSEAEGDEAHGVRTEYPSPRYPALPTLRASAGGEITTAPGFQWMV